MVLKMSDAPGTEQILGTLVARLNCGLSKCKENEPAFLISSYVCTKRGGEGGRTPWLSYSSRRVLRRSKEITSSSNG